MSKGGKMSDSDGTFSRLLRESSVFSLFLWVSKFSSEWARSMSKNFSRSALGRISETVSNWILSSYIYRWLTAEPETTVIEIDLRETLFLSPFIRFFDWFSVRASGRFGGVSFWKNSLMGRSVLSLRKGIKGSRVAEITSRLLEPPEVEEEE